MIRSYNSTTAIIFVLLGLMFLSKCESDSLNHDGVYDIIVSKTEFELLETLPFTLKGFGQIPYSHYHPYKDQNPFDVKGNCLCFSIVHMGCDYTYKLIWDGKFKQNGNENTIVDLKFVLHYTDPCKIANHTDLKYDITPILVMCPGSSLRINFIGYSKLIYVI